MVTIVAFEAMSVSTAMPDVALGGSRAVRGYGLAFSVMLTAQLLGIVLAGVWSDRSGPLPGTFAGRGWSPSAARSAGWRRAIPSSSSAVSSPVWGRPARRDALCHRRPRLSPKAFARACSRSCRQHGCCPRWWAVHRRLADPDLLLALGLPRRGPRSWLLSRSSPAPGAGSVTRRRPARSVIAMPAPTAAPPGPVLLGAGRRCRPVGHRRDRARPGLARGPLGRRGPRRGPHRPRLVPAGTWLMRRGIPSVMLSRALLSAAFGAGIAYVPLLVVTEYHQTLLVAGGLVAAGSLGWATGAWWQGHTRTTVARPLRARRRSPAHDRHGRDRRHHAPAPAVADPRAAHGPPRPRDGRGDDDHHPARAGHGDRG